MKYENLDKVIELCKEIKEVKYILKGLESNEVWVIIRSDAKELMTVTTWESKDIGFKDAAKFIAHLTQTYTYKLIDLTGELEEL